MILNEQGNSINIEGNIKSIEDFEQIKNAIDDIMRRSDSCTLNVIDSISITSSVIGYLMKLVNEGKRIYLNVASEDLYNLLNELNLISILSVKRIWGWILVSVLN